MCQRNIKATRNSSTDFDRNQQGFAHGKAVETADDYNGHAQRKESSLFSDICWDLDEPSLKEYGARRSHRPRWPS